MPDYHIPTDKEIAVKICTIILTDLSRNWSLADLAAEQHITTFTLRRIFKKQYGISLTEYYLKVRMEKAKELLATSNNTIQMIGEAVGYVEGNNFQKRFKKHTGITPGEWRKKFGQ